MRPAAQAPRRPDSFSRGILTRYARPTVAEWLEAGTRAVWVVDPRQRAVIVHESGRDASTFGQSGELPGGEVLPGFAVAVRELFG